MILRELGEGLSIRTGTTSSLVAAGTDTDPDPPNQKDESDELDSLRVWYCGW